MVSRQARRFADQLSPNGDDVQHVHSSLRSAWICEVFHSGWVHGWNALCQTREGRRCCWTKLPMLIRHGQQRSWRCPVVPRGATYTFPLCVLFLLQQQDALGVCHGAASGAVTIATSVFLPARFHDPPRVVSLESRRRHDGADDDERCYSGLPAIKWLIMYRALSGCVYGTCTKHTFQLSLHSLSTGFPTRQHSALTVASHCARGCLQKSARTM